MASEWSSDLGMHLLSNLGRSLLAWPLKAQNSLRLESGTGQRAPWPPRLTTGSIGKFTSAWSAKIQQKVSSGLPEDSQGLASPTPPPLGLCISRGYCWKDCAPPLQAQPIRSLQPPNLCRKGGAQGVSSGQAKMASEWSRVANKLN